MKKPTYLSRYYCKDEHPFISLNDHSLNIANELKLKHCKKNGIGGFYAADDYLLHRKQIEEWIFSEAKRKGGNPISNVPIYMILGDSPNGEYDIRHEIQKNAVQLKIPIEMLDLSAVTFTYPDSMYKLRFNEDGYPVKGLRTNTPQVYFYEELQPIIDQHHIYEKYIHYIEAQVWNRDMLERVLKELS